MPFNFHVSYNFSIMIHNLLVMFLPQINLFFFRFVNFHKIALRWKLRVEQMTFEQMSLVNEIFTNLNLFSGF